MKDQRQRSGSDSSTQGMDKFDESKQTGDINVYLAFYQFKAERVKYTPRYSILDEYHEDSPMYRSLLYGFYQLCLMLACFFLICYPVSRYIDTGHFFDTDLLLLINKNFVQTMATWPAYIIYIHFAFFIEKLVLCGMPTWMEHVIQHSIQSLMLGFTIYGTFKFKSLFSTSRCFIGLMSTVFFMKFHSYITENRRLRNLKQRYSKLAEKQNQKSPSSKKGTTITESAKVQAETLEAQFYPENINYNNFFRFIWIPTFVYHPNYPLKSKFELSFFINKCIKVVFGFLGLYIILSDFIIPVIKNSNNLSFLETVLESLTGIFSFIFLLFYTTEENLCNVFAEMTKFADREFYQDWWNASDYSSFFHKFSKPMGDFTAQYVYLPLLQKFKFSHFISYSMKNFVTGCLLEFIIVITIRGFKPITVVLILLQIPMCKLSNYWQGTTFGNVMFWLSFVFCPPVLLASIMKLQDLQDYFPMINKFI